MLELAAPPVTGYTEQSPIQIKQPKPRFRGKLQCSTQRRPLCLPPCGGWGYVRPPEDSRGENLAEFLYSIYYTSFTRKIYELGGVGGARFTLVGFLLLVPPGSEPPQISFKQEASVPLLHSETCTTMPDFVVLTFLSKHQNKMSLLKEPMQG